MDCFRGGNIASELSIYNYPYPEYFHLKTYAALSALNVSYFLSDEVWSYVVSNLVQICKSLVSSNAEFALYTAPTFIASNQIHEITPPQTNDLNSNVCQITATGRMNFWSRGDDETLSTHHLFGKSLLAPETKEIEVMEDEREKSSIHLNP